MHDDIVLKDGGVGGQKGPWGLEGEEPSRKD